MTSVTIETRRNAVRFGVHVQPRASKSEVVGAHGTALKVRLQAPPVDGAANDALVMFLAEALDVGRRAVQIVSGGKSRSKVVEIEGIDRERVERWIAESTREGVA